MAEDVQSTTSTHTEEYTIVNTGARKPSRRQPFLDDDEPLIDTTAALQLNSKKTQRLKKCVPMLRYPLTDVLDIC